MSIHWRAISVLAFFAGLALAGCNAVTVTKPVGEKVAAVKAGDWDGVWVDERAQGDPITVKTSDAGKGELQVITVNESDGKYITKVYKVYGLESDSWLLASLEDEDSKDGTRYVWGLVKKASDNLVLVYAPDADKFAKLIQDGKLPGKMDKKDVRLGELTADQLKALRDETWGVPFIWQEPAIYRRVSNRTP